ncbi:MAG: hypothetical protein AB200_02595 [Parcubacteria bacterium C7867-005]|nr:MAG: hypothetical protein AB200_02595 [Parcubacteria bacterium C7867-005]
MNPFQALLEKIDSKVAEVKQLFAAILLNADIVVARAELGRVIEALKGSNTAADERNARFVAAEAECALEELNQMEQKFLISAFAVDMMRKRMGGLDPVTLERYKTSLSDRITRYDATRSGRMPDTSELRRQFRAFKADMRRAEAASIHSVGKRAHKALLTPEIVGGSTGSKPASRENKQRARDKSIAHRAMMVRTNRIRSGEQGNKKGVKQKASR